MGLWLDEVNLQARVCSKFSLSPKYTDSPGHTSSWCQTWCALKDIPALPEVILLCKGVLSLVPLKGVKLDSAIKIKLLIPPPQVITGEICKA